MRRLFISIFCIKMPPHTQTIFIRNVEHAACKTRLVVAGGLELDHAVVIVIVDDGHGSHIHSLVAKNVCYKY